MSSSSVKHDSTGTMLVEMERTDASSNNNNWDCWEDPASISGPNSRRRHSLVCVTANYIYIYGGLYNDNNNSRDCVNPEEAWKYNLLTKQWNRMEVRIDPKIMWSNRSAPTTLNGCAFPSILLTTTKNERHRHLPLQLFIFCAQVESPWSNSSELSFFIASLDSEDEEGCTTINCNRLDIHDLDGSFQLANDSLPISYSDFMSCKNIWFCVETVNKLFFIWNCHESLSLLGDEVVGEERSSFQIYQMDALVADITDITRKNMAWTWRKINSCKTECTSAEIAPFMKVAASLRPLIFLWSSARMLCFMNRMDYSSSNSMTSPLSHMLLFSLNDLKFSVKMLNNYPVHLDSLTMLPYTGFDDHFYLFHIHEDNNYSSAALPKKEEAALCNFEQMEKQQHSAVQNVITSAAIIWCLDLKTSQWSQLQRHFYGNINKETMSAEGCIHVGPLVSSTVEFNADGNSVHIFGGRYLKNDDRSVLAATTTVHNITFVPEQLQKLAGQQFFVSVIVPMAKEERDELKRISLIAEVNYTNILTLAKRLWRR